MSRFLFAAVIAVAFAPASLLAQKEPQRTKELKDAERFVAAAMVAPDAAEARARLERALNPLQQAMVKDPDNALVWLTSGQVYAGLGEFARADSAFNKAGALYAPLAADIQRERLLAWNSAFEAGLALMDARKYPEAIVQMENAETVYAGRPESKLNLGALYASQDNIAGAEKAYRAVLVITSGPEVASLQPEEATQWKRFANLATMKVSEVVGARGVKAFEERRYDDAIAAFREGRELNPHTRDHHYNLAQSIYAKARDAENRRSEIDDLKSAEAKQLAADLLAYYTEVEPLVAQTRAIDPHNEDLFQLLMRSYRVRGDLAADAATKARYQKNAGDLLAEHAKLNIIVDNVAALMDGSDANVRGTLRNLKLAAGTPVTIAFTLVGLDGSVIGAQDITVNAPAGSEEAEFEGTAKVTGDVAGWRYQVKL